MVKVIAAGIYSSIQDSGRFGFRKWGVPIAGFMDSQSALLANLLLNNPPNAAVLEMTLKGPILTFEQEALICITGADFRPILDQRAIPLNKVTLVPKGSRLKIGTALSGLRCYLAINGGFDTDIKLGSRSFYQGITKFSKIQKGDVLPFQKSVPSPTPSNTSVRIQQDFSTNPKIPVTKGPEFDHLPPNIQQQLLHRSFTISNESNRMGYRLKTDTNISAPGIITSSVQPGTVQLTPSGQLIVLMRDCPTTGGYARVFQLTEQGICRLAQKRGGERIEFDF